MIRQIPIAALLPGMYVVDLHKRWLDHNIWLPQFMVRDDAQIARLVAEGIKEVSIDTTRGRDLPPSELPTPRPGGRRHHDERLLAASCRLPQGNVSLDEERRRAALLLKEANKTVIELLLDARCGRHVEVGRLEPVVARMSESVRRNPDALAPIARIKGHDSYDTEHAVATAALIIAFGRQQQLPETEIEKMAVGALVKDIGQAAIDARLIAKRGQLSNDEFSLVQSHVEEGLAVLEATARLPETTIAVVLEHHERYNGAGYPFHVPGDDISLAGRMAAIVDTYDAMTSDRPYRAALSPSHALQQLYEQGGQLYDPQLVGAFVRTVGVYPVGTLVLLESGHLAVVTQSNPDLPLQPQIRVIYHAGRRQYVTPVEIDLARKLGNHYGQIVRAESFERWGLSAQRWQPA